jgi:hypothetical protein
MRSKVRCLLSSRPNISLLGIFNELDFRLYSLYSLLVINTGTLSSIVYTIKCKMQFAYLLCMSYQFHFGARVDPQPSFSHRLLNCTSFSLPNHDFLNTA